MLLVLGRAIVYFVVKVVEVWEGFLQAVAWCVLVFVREVVEQVWLRVDGLEWSGEWAGGWRCSKWECCALWDGGTSWWREAGTDVRVVAAVWLAHSRVSF